MKTLCKVEGCCNKALEHYKHGLCSKHYSQIRKTGEIYQTDFEKRMQSLSDRSQMVIEDLRSGMERKEVREKYSLTRSNLKYIIDQYGDESMKIDQSLTPEMINQKLIDYDSNMTYAGEYKRGKHVLLRCNVCGTVMQYPAGSIFKHVNCKKCKEISKLSHQQELESQREAKRQERADAAEERKRTREKESEARMRVVHCFVCGKLFRTTDPRRCACSSECSRKRQNILHSRKKDKRIANDKLIDKIDLLSLYKRDQGICHICGRQCDMQDYEEIGSAFIAGNMYPSIDHIVPVSKGGEDSWANVKLAHRICNSRRGNKNVDAAPIGALIAEQN